MDRQPPPSTGPLLEVRLAVGKVSSPIDPGEEPDEEKHCSFPSPLERLVEGWPIWIAHSWWTTTGEELSRVRVILEVAMDRYL